MALYARMSGVMIIENARSISGKVTVMDITAATTNGTEIFGSVRHFANGEGKTAVQIENGLYVCELRYLKFVMKEEVYNVYSEDDNKYAFVGDLKSWTPVEILSAPPAASVTILGWATKADKAKGTFLMEAEQYSLAHAEAKSAHANALANGALANSTTTSWRQTSKTNVNQVAVLRCLRR
ncbi:hypothetical protein R3P38DRAFT_2758997 [Favolaschia claudopus]|uniref:Uncharacterized protein n=1 Tax=Favolaschia claudopus TaxID=2862362 RepID=A0AAW0E2T2_9AGAR